MANKPKARASTQDHLDIENIIDDLVILKTGWVALVMSTTAVNFDLLSEAEQDATIYAYGAFLNSLSFPIEVLIRSKKADITSYFQSLEDAENAQPNPDLKRQMQKYQDFIQSTVQQKTVLDKKFYIIINFSPLEMGLKGLRHKSPKGKKSQVELVSDAKTTLMPKRDHIIKQTARLGLTTRQLTTQELVELFYDIYNPAPTGTQRILLDTASYTTPMVEPALEVPTPSPEPVEGPAPPPLASLASGGSTIEGSKILSEAEELRPVPPRPEFTPRPPGEGPVEGPAPRSPQPPQPAPSASNQTAALANLQQATARASALLNRPPSQQTSQPVNLKPNPQGLKP